jgi:hypothetical protein
LPLPGFDPAADDERDCAAPVEIFRVDRLPDRPGGRPVNRGLINADGVRLMPGERGGTEEVTFDMVAGMRITYLPGPRWTGAMPVSFYGTIAALTAAWRGLVPLHACAVEVDGRAVLIAGASGAGKSTLAAGLVAAGAHLVADDLTVVSVGERGRIEVARGRPTMRLHPDTATRLDTIAAVPVDGDPRGKWLVRPRRRSGTAPLDLAAVLLLDEDAAAMRPARPAALFAHLFRPRWIDALPMRGQLMADVLAIAARVPILTYPAQGRFTAPDWLGRADAVLATVRALCG